MSTPGPLELPDDTLDDASITMQGGAMPEEDSTSGWSTGETYAGAGSSSGFSGSSTSSTSSMAAAQAEDDEPGLALREYGRILLKRRWQVLLVLVGALAISLLYTLLTTPLYRATAVVQVESRTMRILGGSEAMEVGDRSGDFLGTQVELLQSRAVAERAVRDLALLSDPAYQESLNGPSGWRALWRMVGGGTPPPSENLSLAAREASAVDHLRANLTVAPRQRTSLIEVAYISADPKVAQRVADGVAAAFIQLTLDRRVDSSQFARRFLEDRLQQTKVRLQDSERALIEYAQEQSISNLDQSIGQETKNLEALSAELTSVQAARLKAEAKLAQFSSAQGISLDALNSPVLETLRQKLVELQGDYESKRATFKPDYPEMLALQRRVNETRAQMEAERLAYQRATEGEARSARANESLLQAQIAKLQSRLLDYQGRSIRYNILKRESDTNRQLYDGLLQRYKEIGVSGDFNDNVSVLDRAQPGALYRPRVLLNLLAGLLAGLVLGLGLAFLLEQLDDTLKVPEDLERQLQVPLLGIVPRVPPDEFDAALLAPKSSLSEAYRSLRTALQYATETGVPRVLMVTSSQAGEGKSTTSQVLAMQFAQLGQRVLIMDVDLRKPTLEQRFGLPEGPGLTDYLKGKLGAEVPIRPAQPNVWVITAGAVPSNPAELLATPRFRALVKSAAGKFDQVILDCPPLLGLADVPTLTACADGALLVVAAGETRAGVVRASLKRLAATRVPLLGAVLVRFDARAAGYGYGYGYNYANHRYYGAAYGAYGDDRESADAADRRGTA